jgi:hypothetical protein
MTTFKFCRVLTISLPKSGPADREENEISISSFITFRIKVPIPTIDMLYSGIHAVLWIVCCSLARVHTVLEDHVRSFGAPGNISCFNQLVIE